MTGFSPVSEALFSNHLLMVSTKTRDQTANIHWIIDKSSVSEKHLFLLY